MKQLGLLGMAVVLAASLSAQATTTGPSTLFHCKGFPNYRQDLIIWASVNSHQPQGRMLWNNGAEIRLQRIRPHVMKYEIYVREKKITDGTLKSNIVQFAMTAGGVELHCVTSPEN